MRVLASILLVLGGCTSVQKNVLGNWPTMSASERQAAIEGISAECSYPVDRMQIGPGNQLHFRPQPNDSYEKVACALEELRRYRGIGLGFIGNEAYSDKQP